MFVKEVSTSIIVVPEETINICVILLKVVRAASETETRAEGLASDQLVTLGQLSPTQWAFPLSAFSSVEGMLVLGWGSVMVGDSGVCQ